MAGFADDFTFNPVENAFNTQYDYVTEVSEVGVNDATVQVRDMQHTYPSGEPTEVYDGRGGGGNGNGDGNDNGGGNRWLDSYGSVDANGGDHSAPPLFGGPPSNGTVAADVGDATNEEIHEVRSLEQNRRFQAAVLRTMESQLQGMEDQLLDKDNLLESNTKSRQDMALSMAQLRQELLHVKSAMVSFVFCVLLFIARLCDLNHACRFLQPIFTFHALVIALPYLNRWRHRARCSAATICAKSP
jgi:hypothetical protein